MTLASTSSALGVSLATAAGSVDPFGIARWAAIADALGSWFPGSVTFVATGLSGTAGTISGNTSFVFNATDLGAQLADGAQSTDAAGIAAWGRIGDAIISHCESYGQGTGSGLTYAAAGSGLPVPVIGEGAISFTDTTSLGTALADAAGSTDIARTTAWPNIATQILTWLTTNGKLMPTTSGSPTLTVPDTGGPCVGAGELR